MTEQLKPKEKTEIQKPKLTPEEIKRVNKYKKISQLIVSKESIRNLLENQLLELKKKNEPNEKLNTIREEFSKKQKEIEEYKKQLEEIKNKFSEEGKNIEDFLNPSQKKVPTKRHEDKKESKEKKASAKIDLNAEFDPQTGSVNLILRELSKQFKNPNSSQKLIEIIQNFGKKRNEKKTEITKLEEEGEIIKNIFTILKAEKSNPKLEETILKFDAKDNKVNLEKARKLSKKEGKKDNKPKSENTPTAADNQEKSEIETKGIAKKSLMFMGILIKKFPGLGDMLRNLYLAFTKGDIDPESKKMTNNLLKSIFGAKQLEILKKWLKLTPGDLKNEEEKERKQEFDEKKFISEVAGKEKFNGQILFILTKSNLLPLAFKLAKNNKDQKLNSKQLELLANRIGKANPRAALLLKNNEAEINKILGSLTRKHPSLSTTKKHYLENSQNVSGIDFLKTFYLDEENSSDQKQKNKEKKENQQKKLDDKVKQLRKKGFLIQVENFNKDYAKLTIAKNNNKQKIDIKINLATSDQTNEKIINILETIEKTADQRGIISSLESIKNSDPSFQFSEADRSWYKNAKITKITANFNNNQKSGQIEVKGSDGSSKTIELVYEQGELKVKIAGKIYKITQNA